MDNREKTKLLNQGAFYTRAYEYDKAIQCFDRILKSDPQDAEALLNKGAVLLAKEDFVGALSVINAGLDQNPRHPEAWANKAKCLHALNQAGWRGKDIRIIQSALECCDKALELDKLYELAWETKCRILLDMRQYEKSLAVASEALETGIVTPEMFLMKTEALYYTGKFSVALLNINSALLLDPDNEIARTDRILCLDAIAKLPEPWRTDELVYKDEIDERYLPRLNQVFPKEQKTETADDDWWDERHISADKLLSKGFDTSSIKSCISAERISRINRISSFSTLQEIVNPETKLLFLCGSGISFDSPSNLPTGGQFQEGLIKAIVPPSLARDQLLREISEVPGYRLPALGFEIFLQVVQEFLDPSLHILNLFSFCSVPNRNHFFLARMIMRGHLVITTNFDALIEEAFRKLLPNKTLKVLITGEDFKHYVENPSKYEYTLVKLHGSLINLSGQDVRDSIKATLLQVGQAGYMFSSEPHKKEVVENLLRDKPLLVLGYSGYDEVDIVSLLVETKSAQKVIWINHKESGSTAEEGLTRCEFILARMEDEKYDSSEAKQSRFFLYNGLSNKAIDDISRCKLSLLERTNMGKILSDLEKQPFEVNVSQYLKDWRDLFVDKSWLISSVLARLYHHLGKLEEAKFYAEDALRLLPFKAKDTPLAAMLHNNLGIAYGRLGQKEKELHHMKEALDIFENLEDFYDAATVSANIAVLYTQQYKDDEALKYAERGMADSKKIEEDERTMGTLLTLLGGLAFRRCEYETSRSYLEKAIVYRKQTGDLRGLLVTYEHLAKTLYLLGDTTKSAYYTVEQARLERAITPRGAVIEFGPLGLKRRFLD